MTTIELRDDRIYEFAALWVKPGAQEQLNEYFAQAVPIAIKYGAKPGLARFVPVNAYSGSFTPTVASLSEWPSLDAFRQFIDDPELKRILPQRDGALDRLVVTHCRVPGSSTIELHSGRTYEWAAAWVKPGKEQQLGAYMQKVTPMAIQRGGRPGLAKFSSVSAAAGDFLPPGLALNEWPSLDAFRGFIDDVGSDVKQRDDAVDRLVVTQYALAPAP